MYTGFSNMRPLRIIEHAAQEVSGMKAQGEVFKKMISPDEMVLLEK